MRFFKEQTTGNACVMGRKTWLTLKKPLPNRLNVVLSRRQETEPREAVVTGPCEAVAWMRDRLSVLSLKDFLKCDLYVIGGAQVFEMFREDIERWVVTEVPLSVEGADTFMPVGFLEGFAEHDSRLLGDELTVRFYSRQARIDA
jgi:dihydrofolate reductase